MHTHGQFFEPPFYSNLAATASWLDFKESLLMSTQNYGNDQAITSIYSVPISCPNGCYLHFICYL